MASFKTREAVYKAIDSEREYQDAMGGNSARSTLDDNRDQGSLVALLQHYQNKLIAAHAAPNSLGSEEVTGTARKIAALSVLLMERYGAPLRS